MENKLITPRELYNRLNITEDSIIGINTIYKLIRRKDFPSLKVGNRFYIKILVLN